MQENYTQYSLYLSLYNPFGHTVPTIAFHTDLDENYMKACAACSASLRVQRFLGFFSPSGPPEILLGTYLASIAVLSEHLTIFTAFILSTPL